MSIPGGRVVLPEWAVVTPKRLEHIERVVRLLDHWAAAATLSIDDAREWHDAGRFHDALRDAPEHQLRALVPDLALPTPLLHGYAAARMLETEGERRPGLVEAVRYHTLGSPLWGATGRALYCADFLEPGRAFDVESRRRLAERFPSAPVSVFGEVVRLRIAQALQTRHQIHPQTVETWNSII